MPQSAISFFVLFIQYLILQECFKPLFLVIYYPQRNILADDEETASGDNEKRNNKDKEPVDSHEEGVKDLYNIKWDTYFFKWRDSTTNGRQYKVIYSSS